MEIGSLTELHVRTEIGSLSDLYIRQKFRPARFTDFSDRDHRLPRTRAQGRRACASRCLSSAR